MNAFCCVAEEMFQWVSRSRSQLYHTGRAIAAINPEPRLVFTRVALFMFLNKMKAVSVITDPNCTGAVQAPEIEGL